MPIQDSRMLKPPHDRGNGTLRVFEIHTDHNGNKYMYPSWPPVGTDVNQVMLDRVPDINKSLIKNEKDYFQSAIENGTDPLAFPIKHLTIEQKDKRVVMALMRGEDRKVIRALEFIDNMNTSRRQNVISLFNSNQIPRIQARLIRIRENKAFLQIDTREDLNV